MSMTALQNSTKDWRVLAVFWIFASAIVAATATVGLFGLNTCASSGMSRSPEKTAQEWFFKHPSKLLGLSRDEVVERLGETNHAAAASEWSLSYYIGPAEEYFPDHGSWLMLGFQDGVVNDVRILIF